jgi:hypothetical protein
MTPDNDMFLNFSKGKGRNGQISNNNVFPKRQIEKPNVPIFINNSYLDNKKRMKRPSLHIKRK